MAATATDKFAGFADKQPAFLRSVILPEDQDAFDEQYQAAVASAAETHDLTELEKFLHALRPRRPGGLPDLGV